MTPVKYNGGRMSSTFFVQPRKWFPNSPPCFAPLRAFPLLSQTPNASLRFAKVEQCERSFKALRFASPPSAASAAFATPLRSACFGTSAASLRTRYSLRSAPLVFISRPPSQGSGLRPPHFPPLGFACRFAPLRFTLHKWEQLYANR